MSANDTRQYCVPCTLKVLQFVEVHDETRLMIATSTTDDLSGVLIDETTDENGLPHGTGAKKWKMSVSTYLTLILNPRMVFENWRLLL